MIGAVDIEPTREHDRSSIDAINQRANVLDTEAQHSRPFTCDVRKIVGILDFLLPLYCISHTLSNVRKIWTFLNPPPLQCGHPM